MMENLVRFSSVTVKNNVVKAQFSAEGHIKRFLRKNELTVEYDRQSIVAPPDILALPLIMNLLPLVWATGATLYVDTLDNKLFSSLSKLQDVFRKCYPGIAWEGRLMVGRLVTHSNGSKGSLLLFSGGLDSIVSYLRHIHERPKLVVVWGADIGLENKEGWNQIWTNAVDFAEKFHTQAIWIKSDFRELIDYRLVDLKFKDILGRSWWGAVQHALGLLGLCMPVAYMENAESIYLAAEWWHNAKFLSGTMWGPHCKIEFRNHCVSIDGWELSRQEKVRSLVTYAEQNKLPITIRVCWRSPDGKNCGRCEKCSRTIVALEVEGADPNYYGFPVDDSTFSYIRSQLETGEWLNDPSVLEYWLDIAKKCLPPYKCPHREATRLALWLQQTDLKTLVRKNHNVRFFRLLKKILVALPEPLFETIWFIGKLTKKTLRKLMGRRRKNAAQC